MQAVTIREAKARLNALVEAVQRGEQVVLMRGATHVAAIVPLSADDLELSARLTDAQAGRLWRQLAAERDDGSSVIRESAAAAVAFLAPQAAARVSRARRTAGTGRKR